MVYKALAADDLTVAADVNPGSMSKKPAEATPPVAVDEDDDDDEDDPLENAIKKTGCIELHHELQECMADNKDWRQCQSKVVAFRKCMSDYHTKQQAGYGNKVS